MATYIRTNKELYHHGIKGQKWGDRNGPPYPLEPGDHSASEKKAGYTKSISGSGEESSNSKTSSTKEPKARRSGGTSSLGAHMSTTKADRDKETGHFKQYKAAARKYAEGKSVGRIVTQTVLTQIGLTAANVAINSAIRDTGAEAALPAINGVFAGFTVANAAIGITAAVQKGRGKYDN